MTTREKVKTLIKPMENQNLDKWIIPVSMDNVTGTYLQSPFISRFQTLAHFQIDHLVNWVTRNDGTIPNATPQMSQRSEEKASMGDKPLMIVDDLPWGTTAEDSKAAHKFIWHGFCPVDMLVM